MIIANSRINHTRLTGVQRYLNEILSRCGDEIAAVAPRAGLDGVPGHLWEQAVLPRAAHSHLLWSPSNTGPLAVAHQVVTIHDVVPLDHPEWQNWRFAKWYRFLLPRLARRVRHVIAVSSFTKQRLVAASGVAPEKITIIPNGVDARFHPQVPRNGTALHLPPRYLLTVGSLEPRKNLGRLLQAWAKVQSQLPEDIWLVIAGGRGKPIVFSTMPGLDTAIPRVHFTGYIADDLLPALYAGAAGFAYVSEYEGFGLPPLEAMASGVPVLVSHGSAFPEVVGQAGLYANPHDVNDIAHGILELLTNHDITQQLSQLGPARARQFTWERCAEQTLRVLREAAASNKNGTTLN